MSRSAALTATLLLMGRPSSAGCPQTVIASRSSELLFRVWAKALGLVTDTTFSVSARLYCHCFASLAMTVYVFFGFSG